jgi:hypothetical protein
MHNVLRNHQSVFENLANAGSVILSAAKDLAEWHH